ncbi:MAG: hypothetical protein M1377_04955 [Deltaproteobacteria bacterium]|nr:hypothetical protein [Deltaproteobacteria bacterium]
MKGGAFPRPFRSLSEGDPPPAVLLSGDGVGLAGLVGELLLERFRREGKTAELTQWTGAIREIRETVVSHGADNFALEHRLAVSVDIRVVELVHGRLLWKGEGLSESASYYAGADFQYTESNRRTAFEEVSRRLARRIGQTLRVLL